MAAKYTNPGVLLPSVLAQGRAIALPILTEVACGVMAGDGLRKLDQESYCQFLMQENKRGPCGSPVCHAATIADATGSRTRHPSFKLLFRKCEQQQHMHVFLFSTHKLLMSMLSGLMEATLSTATLWALKAKI